MAKKESGYAWFVVFCSFALHFITDGVSYTFGIFFSEFRNEFNISKASTAWVPSIMTGMTYCVGPIASALTNKYGCRAISVTGTTFTAIGFFLSTFATNLNILYFTIGILAGSGFGLIYLPAIVIITQYFTKRLALAIGLAVSASGIGSALFAPVTEYLVIRYGWRYAMQIVSFILFISGLFGLSFKKFEYDDESIESEEYIFEDGFDDEISKQKIVKFDQKFDLSDNKEKEKLMKDDVLNKLCKENILTSDVAESSQINSDDSKSEEKHTYIIENNRNEQIDIDENSRSNLNKHNQKEIMITINEPKKQHNKFFSNKYDDNDCKIDKDEGKKQKISVKQIQSKNNLNLSTNLLTNNLTISLNTNLNNLNNLPRINETPRLSLDSSSNYKLQHQLQQHQHLQQSKTHRTAKLDLKNEFIAQINGENSNDEEQNQLNVNKTNQIDEHKYRSFISLHQSKPISNSEFKTNSKKHSTNLNTILLYSTSMSSLNYCFPEREIKTDDEHTKKYTLSHKKLNSTFTTPCQQENLIDGMTDKNFINKTPLTSSKPIQYRNRRSTLDTFINLGRNINALLSWNLLRDRIFLWFAISNFLTSLGYAVPYTYIKDVCLLLPQMVNDRTSDCSFLISIIGFSSTVGRIFFGFLSDFKRFKPIHIYAHCLTLCGLCTIFFMFSYQYYILAIYSAIFGLTTSAFVGLTTVIIVDLLGPAFVSNAFGLLLLFQGVASLIGPPIVGLFYDYTSSYNAGFMLIGIFIVKSGLMLYFIPFFKK